MWGAGRYLGKEDRTRNPAAVFLASYSVPKVLVTLSCPTLCDPMDRRLLCLRDSPGKNTGVGCSRGSSQPRDRTWVSCIAGRFFARPGKPSCPEFV